MQGWSLDEELEREVEDLRKAGIAYARAKGYRVSLELKKHSIHAVAMQQSGEESVSAQSREAYASLQYQQWVQQYADAIYDEERARVEYEALRYKGDLIRTQQATRRAEMSLR
jgi:DNA repair photolyase